MTADLMAAGHNIKIQPFVNLLARARSDVILDPKVQKLLREIRVMGENQTLGGSQTEGESHDVRGGNVEEEKEEDDNGNDDNDDYFGDVEIDYVLDFETRPAATQPAANFPVFFPDDTARFQFWMNVIAVHSGNRNSAANPVQPGPADDKSDKDEPAAEGPPQD